MQIISIIKQVFLLSLVVYFLNGCSENEKETFLENVEINLKHNEIFKDTIETFIDLGGAWLTSYEGLDSIDYKDEITYFMGNIYKGKIINDFKSPEYRNLLQQGEIAECFICGNSTEVLLKPYVDTNVLVTYKVIQTGTKRIKNRQLNVLKTDIAGYPIYDEWIDEIPVFEDSIINEFKGFYNKDSTLLRLTDYNRGNVIYLKLLNAPELFSEGMKFVYEQRRNYLDVSISDEEMTDSFYVFNYDPLNFYDSSLNQYNLFPPYVEKFNSKTKIINTFFNNRNITVNDEMEKIKKINEYNLNSFFSQSEIFFYWKMRYNQQEKINIIQYLENLNLKTQETENTSSFLKNSFDFSIAKKEIELNLSRDKYSQSKIHSYDPIDSVMNQIESLIFKNFIQNAKINKINLNNFVGNYRVNLSFVSNNTNGSKIYPVILFSEKNDREFLNSLEIILSNTEFSSDITSKLQNHIIPLNINIKLPYNYDRVSKLYPENFETCCGLTPDSLFYSDLIRDTKKNDFYTKYMSSSSLLFKKLDSVNTLLNSDIDDESETYFSANIDVKPSFKNTTLKKLKLEIQKILLENPFPDQKKSEKIKGRLLLIFTVDKQGKSEITFKFSDEITNYFMNEALRKNLSVDFHPGKHKGENVKSIFQVVINDVAY